MHSINEGLNKTIKQCDSQRNNHTYFSSTNSTTPAEMSGNSSFSISCFSLSVISRPNKSGQKKDIYNETSRRSQSINQSTTEIHYPKLRQPLVGFFVPKTSPHLSPFLPVWRSLYRLLFDGNIGLFQNRKRLQNNRFSPYVVCASNSSSKFPTAIQSLNHLTLSPAKLFSRYSITRKRQTRQNKTKQNKLEKKKKSTTLLASRRKRIQSLKSS